jgi:transcription elongation factor Elf1
MYYLVTVDHKGMAVHLTRSDCEEFSECCISKAVEGTDDDKLWSDSEEEGSVRRKCEENEGTDCEDGDCDTA